MIDRIVAFFILCLILGLPVGIAIFFTGQVLLQFVFFYPLLMSGIWITGGVWFWLVKERHWLYGENVAAPKLKNNPLVSILIPCYNEGLNVREVIQAALSQNYQNVEIIAINDGSSDNTAEVLNQIAAEEPRLRVIHLIHNQGKAVALHMGAVSARSEYLVCIDGDAQLEANTVAYLVAPLIDNPRVSAVTGNPLIRTRSTLIGRIQVGEFTSIIGLIKRTQRILGRVFTVSGVIVAFRRKALDEVGYWSPDMITEDIDISWKLQLNNWGIFYEPRALCWVLMPETLLGLWRQRLRWAQGGAEVFLKNMFTLWHWRHRNMWPLFIEVCLSTLWAFSFALSVILYFLGMIISLPENIVVHPILPPAFTGMVLAIVCLIQFIISILIGRRYEKNIGASLFWIIWYPLVFWLLTLFTTLVAFPKVMLKAKRQRARWVSPDRGIARQHNE